MESTRVPNARLRALLHEAEWSGTALAQAVNALGAENGLRLSYSRSSVAQWLAGTSPRRVVAPLIVEALGRRLSRPVTAFDAGLASLPDVRPANPSRRLDPARTLTFLAVSHGQKPRPPDRGSSPAPYSIDVLAQMSGACPPASPAFQSGPTLSPVRLTPEHVQAAREILTVFARTDHMWGGGHARQALETYLRAVVVPALLLPGGRATRGSMRETASKLAYLCGFVNFDAGRHGPAQHYYVTALHLAEEAGNGGLRALALRALSVQAESLGHALPALHLARASFDTARPDNLAPDSMAFLLGQVSVAEAAAGDRQAALSALTRAESYLDRTDNERADPGVGIYHHGSLALQRAAVASRFGQHAAAVRALESSLRHRPADERRSRVMTLARLAQEQLLIGHLDAACATWHVFCDEYPFLRSGRAEQALHAAYQRIRPHSSSPHAKALIARITELRAAHGPGRRPD